MNNLELESGKHCIGSGAGLCAAGTSLLKDAPTIARHLVNYFPALAPNTSVVCKIAVVSKGIAGVGCVSLGCGVVFLVAGTGVVLYSIYKASRRAPAPA